MCDVMWCVPSHCSCGPISFIQSMSSQTGMNLFHPRLGWLGCVAALISSQSGMKHKHDHISAHAIQLCFGFHPRLGWTLVALHWTFVCRARSFVAVSKKQIRMAQEEKSQIICRRFGSLDERNHWWHGPGQEQHTSLLFAVKGFEGIGTTWLQHHWCYCARVRATVLCGQTELETRHQPHHSHSGADSHSRGRNGATPPRPVFANGQLLAREQESIHVHFFGIACQARNLQESQSQLWFGWPHTWRCRPDVSGAEQHSQKRNCGYYWETNWVGDSWNENQQTWIALLLWHHRICWLVEGVVRPTQSILSQSHFSALLQGAFVAFLWCNSLCLSISLLFLALHGFIPVWDDHLLLKDS